MDEESTAHPQPEPGWLGEAAATLDLTTSDPLGPRHIEPPQVASYDHRRAREWVRGGLAIALMTALLVVVAGSGWFFIWHADEVDLLQKYLSVVMTPLVALVGALTGFYFGEKASDP